MIDLVVALNCSIARVFPREAKLVSERTGLSGRAKSVKRFSSWPLTPIPGQSFQFRLIISVPEWSL